MSKQYSKYLERAYEKIPKKIASEERFEIPVPSSAIFGPKTIVYNFGEICQKMNRDPRQLLKFLTKEMATAGSVDGTRVIFQGKFNDQTIKQLLHTYCDRFIICPICKRPDTRVEREDRFLFLICDACGAKSSITSP